MNRSMRHVFGTERARDGHHAIACRLSARRHRQGPKAARMRGRSEAQRLARCRAQMHHHRRDDRRSKGDCECDQRARSMPSSHAIRSRGRISREELGREHASMWLACGASVSGKFRTRSSGKMWTRSARLRCTNTRRVSAPHVPSRTRQRQWQPWRERPLRTGAGPRRARAAGSLTPWSPSPTVTAAPAVGGKERRPITECARAPHELPALELVTTFRRSTGR